MQTGAVEAEDETVQILQVNNQLASLQTANIVEIITIHA